MDINNENLTEELANSINSYKLLSKELENHNKSIEQYKLEHNIPILDKERQNAILDKVEDKLILDKPDNRFYSTQTEQQIL